MGKYILPDTSQRKRKQAQIAGVDLLPHVPKYREDEFRELFRPSKTPGSPTTQVTAPNEEKPVNSAGLMRRAETKTDAKPEAKKKVEPVKIVFKGIRDRPTFLPLGLNAQEPVISLDGKTPVFGGAYGETSRALRTFPLDELSEGAAGCAAADLRLPGTQKRHYVFGNWTAKMRFDLENGTVKPISLESRTPKTIMVTAPMQIDFDVEKKVVFEEAGDPEPSVL